MFGAVVAGEVSVSVSVEIHCRTNTDINAAGERERGALLRAGLNVR